MNSKTQTRGAILIIIDGCRADVLTPDLAPNIQRLMSIGAYTLEATTVIPPLTLPVHFSIFTSLPPESHHVLTNADRPQPAPHARSIVELVKMAGKSTAFFYNWENLRDIPLPGFLDHALFMANNAQADGDLQIAAAAADYAVEARPDFCFVYLGGADEIGHRCGFMSQPYLERIGTADRAVGSIFSALAQAALLDRYNILIHSDHGGLGNTHHGAAPEILTVPWLAVGPDIARKTLIKGSVSVLDSSPTLAKLLTLDPDPSWQGRAVAEAFR